MIGAHSGCRLDVGRHFPSNCLLWLDEQLLRSTNDRFPPRRNKQGVKQEGKRVQSAAEEREKCINQDQVGAVLFQKAFGICVE